MILSPFDVSRETMIRLELFHNLAEKWTKKINLLSRSNQNDLWDRHIWDSAQLISHANQDNRWVDIGSGGGFPGIVIAILLKETSSLGKMTLIESDRRKCVFLREAIRLLDLDADVLSARVEEAPAQGADVLTARALSDLTTLLGFAQRHLSASGKALFLKGATWEKEVEMARKSWSFRLTNHKSKTNKFSAVLEIEDIERV